MTPNRRTFLDVPPDSVLSFIESQRVPSFRARQIYEWFFKREAANFHEMTDLPQDFRQALEARFRLHPLALRRQETSSLDGTIRYHFQAQDAQDVSAVYLPEGERAALCLSTQVGCAYRCAFCASGLVPFQRQLSAAEIVDQVLWVRKDRNRWLTNILFMGMGEPLANYTQVTQAIRWISAPHGVALSPSRITLSTSGLVPQILRLADDGIRVKLAISLHAVQDDLRAKLMPVSGRFGARALVKAAKRYARVTKAPVTFEYILLKDVNDRLQDANRLSYLIKGFLNHVNLILYNPVPGLPFNRPEWSAVMRFQAWLRERGVLAFIRKPKGLDIGAACGQLGPFASR